MTEDQLHTAIVTYLRTVLPDALVWHTPNAPRSAVAGARLKRLGMVAGVPDLALLTDGQLWFFEVKAAKGRVSEAQEAFMDAAYELGAQSAVVRSLDDVAMALARWGIRTRVAA